MNKNVIMKRVLLRSLLALGIAMLFGSCASSSAYRVLPTTLKSGGTLNEKTLTLVVQPTGSTLNATLEQYELLSAYLEKKTGKKIKIKSLHNYLEYWNLVKQPDKYDIALDAAHFTDYRINRFNFRLVARQQNLASYSLLSLSDNPVGSLHKLAGRAIAVHGAPSMDALRLDAMFHDPSRQPIVVPINNYINGIDLLTSGKADAIFVPSQLAFELSKIGNRFRIIAITEPVNPNALSVSASLDPVTQKLIQNVFMMAHNDPEGRDALASAGLTAFVPAHKEEYTGYSKLLSGVWDFGKTQPEISGG